MNEQVPSKELVTDRGIVACEGIGCIQLSDQQGNVIELTHTDRQQLASLFRAAHEPRMDHTCECSACAEFARMQHDIASLLGIDADTDAIDLHGRIYGVLSQRAAQPPAPEQPSAAFRELMAIARAARDVCAYDWSDNDVDAVAAMDRLHDAVGPWLARSTSTKGGE